jgi:transcriptional regulator with XRE-family HTH domain
MQGKLRTEWIVDRLRELGKRHVDLARAMGLSQSKLSRTLRGDRRLQVPEMLALCEFLEVPIESAAHLCMGNETEIEASDGASQSAAQPALSGPLIEKIALYVLKANAQFGAPQSSAQLASTIAQFCMTFQGDPENYEEFERQLEEAITTAVRFTPKPSVGVEDG